ncbi:Protein saf4 [Tilletia horrida]|nr:Protein saf4 [Tilletia horrida]
MQGFNMGRYRPPDDDPSKVSWNKSHALGKRAHKLDQGILVVRFELPFDIWCGSCETHIGQGVRFNAEKRKIGNYLSSPIYAFRCKCATCKNFFEVRTDPKNASFKVTEGARQKEEDWDPEENGGLPVFDTEASSSAQPLDAFSQLEKTTSQQTRAKSAQERILELEKHATARSSDPYALNFRLRSSFRVEKKELQHELRQDNALRQRIGWDEDRALVKEDEQDRREAHAAWARERDEAARRKVEAGHITPRTRSAALMSNSRHSTELVSTSSAGRKMLAQSAGASSSSKTRSSRHQDASATKGRAAAAASTSKLTAPAKALAARVLANTKRKSHPFGA